MALGLLFALVSNAFRCMNFGSLDNGAGMHKMGMRLADFPFPIILDFLKDGSSTIYRLPFNPVAFHSTFSIIIFLFKSWPADKDVLAIAT